MAVDTSERVVELLQGLLDCFSDPAELVTTLDYFVESVRSKYIRPPPPATPSRDRSSRTALPDCRADDPVPGGTPPSVEPRDLGDAPGPQPSLKARRKARGQNTTADELIPISLPLTPDLGVPQLQHSRNVFYERVQQIRVPLTSGTKRQAVQVDFSPVEAKAISNFFFTEVMGQEAWYRLENLIKTYSGDQVREQLARSSMLADRLSRSADVPPIVRAFYESYYHAFKASSRSTYAGFQKVVADVDLYNRWVELRARAAARDLDLLGFLEQRGYETRVGVDFRSLVNQFLSDSLNLPKKHDLQNICQSSQGIAELVHVFGQGIIVLLPPNTGSKLNRWGNARMSAVYPLLRDLVPSFLPICQMTKTYLFDPIMQGASLQLPEIPPPIAPAPRSPPSLSEMIRQRVVVELEDGTRSPSHAGPTADAVYQPLRS